MNKELSRKLGYVLGTVYPPPTLEQRELVINASSGVEFYQDLPKKVRDLVEAWERQIRSPKRAAPIQRRPTNPR
jgi:hypothetical protein